MKTKTLLVDDLLKKQITTSRDAIIKQAKKGFYHDFETPIALPKMQLFKDLTNAGFLDLADEVKNGRYD